MSEEQLPRIRLEQPDDNDAIRTVNELGFGQQDEADLVDALRRDCPERVSWVAEIDGRIVGHLLFTPVTLEAGDQTLFGMGLAPMAVLPDYQNRGVGTLLVETGIAKLDADGCPFIVVLGHPRYYPRFGFLPASEFGVSCQWETPDEAFMIRFPGVPPANLTGGVAFYREEFDTIA